MTKPYLKKRAEARDELVRLIPEGSASVDLLHDQLDEWFDKYFPTDGALMIAQERVRQIDEEGYTPETDADREPAIVRGDPNSRIPPLVRAAVSYLVISVAPSMWPWPWLYFKPQPVTGSKTRDLEKAGALIAAEIDRILLKEEKNRD